ncbi:helix-turn-helix domain-containing protein [Saccharibacter floricola]|uniref:helix-turn-helix domain-containing protein n=1 Tax=Saccharibacter floricola TaxID=231053 RepID=UPI001FE078C7|nr:helix-turn-helix transcriptional regulator [Saccharibacter floricola]
MVRDIRIAHGDRLLDAARKLGTKAAVISRMERGGYEVSDKIVERFIDAYGLNENADSIRKAASAHNDEVRKNYPTLQELMILTPAAIQQYLAANGWQKLGFYSEHSLCYEYPDNGMIIVPDGDTVTDYPRMVLETIRLLSYKKDRTPRQIYQDILQSAPEATSSKKTSYNRVAHDWYVEPEHATDRLLAVEKPFSGTILDPCCGQGNILRACGRAGVKAVGSDIVDHGIGARVEDFSAAIPDLKPTSIISNPPFNQAEKFVKLALDHTQGRVCLFLRAAFLEGIKRSEWLKQTPPARVWHFPDRISCVPGHLLGQKQKHSGTTAYAWVVWERGHRGPYAGYWLPEKKKERSAS